MALPTVSDVQAADPILTNMLVAYEQADNRFVASKVFPAVPVEKDNGKYPTFTKKYWFLDDLVNRAPGNEFAEVGFGASSDTYATLQWAAQEAIADETRANSQIPLDLESVATRHLGQLSLIRKERAFATDFMAAVWGTDGSVTAKFDVYATSDPVKDVQTAVRTISAATGVLANTAVMGHIVQDRIANHPDVIDRVKYSRVATMSNMFAILADVFGLANWWVSLASYNTVNEAQSGTYANIIDDDLLICYVTPNPGLFEASAGYTFSWAGGGGMGTIARVRDDLKHRDVVQIMEQWDQKQVASDVGYIYRDCTD